jgi:hypothetical protein
MSSDPEFSIAELIRIHILARETIARDAGADRSILGGSEVMHLASLCNNEISRHDLVLSMLIVYKHQ